MLPTNEAIGEAPIMQEDDKLYSVKEYGNRNLYILSDEKIKEGDWCIGNDKIHAKSPDEFFIAQCTSVVNGWIYLEGHEGEGNNPDYTKKIIATTNTSLKFGKDFPSVIRYKTLPQPSQSFIEKYITEYNKGNVVTNVMVEYEAIGNWRHAEFVHTRDIPKINLKDNTITIKKGKG